MCDPEVEYSIDLIMSDAYYQAVSYYNRWYTLVFELDTEEPEGGGDDGGDSDSDGGDDGPVNESIQNEDGSYKAAESIGEFLSMLIDCESLDEVLGVVWASLVAMLGL